MWLLIGGLIGSGFAITWGLNRPHGEPRSGSRQLPSAMRNSFVPLAPAVQSGGKDESDGEIRRSVSRSASSFNDQPSNHSPGDAPDVAQNESRKTSGSPVSAAAESDQTVVGRPFPVSASVEALCRKLSSRGEDNCALSHSELADFARQPRDPAWASEMEARLRDLVASESGYTVRTIECRTSMCVAEVASLRGMFHFVTAIGENDALNESLTESSWETAYEPDPSSASIGVTVGIFRRRH